MSTRLFAVTSDAAVSAATPPRYWAFISYSHRDEAVARALQKRLETYRLPPKLVGRATPLGPVPRRARPIFRDRDELHAGADLKAEVRAALAASRWLIVVCSPDAARSPWVGREIVEFKRLHGEGRVLALIARGEPFASRLAGRTDDECLPDALLHALDRNGEPKGEALEPIAADARAHADGPKRAALKLLAGMVGVGFDELIRRDATRRLRWMGAIAAGSLAGMAVLGVLTVLAVQARNDARQQREQAEGLIEFMLGDLRKKLEPVGRLDVLDAVGSKALAHYEAQDASRLDAQALGHRSRAQHLIGEMRQQRGQLEPALRAYEQAAATTQRLLAAAPDDPQRIFDHAQSEFWVGLVARERGQIDAAERAFTGYRTLAQRLVKIDPANTAWRTEDFYATYNLGVLKLDGAQPAAALVLLDEARRTLTAISTGQPDQIDDLAQTYGFMAVAHESLGHYAEATEMQRAKQALFIGMPDLQRNQTAQRGLQNASQQLGQLALAQGRLAEALTRAQDSVTRAAAIVQRDPSNMVRLGESVLARLLLANVEWASGHDAAARTALPALRGDINRLHDLEPSNVSVAIGMRGDLLALSARTHAEPAASLMDAMNAYTGELRRLRTSGIHLKPLEQRRAAGVRLEFAELLVAAGRPDEAREQWQAVIDELTASDAEENPRLMTLRAHALAAIGERAAALRLLDRIRETSFRHPDYRALTMALGEPSS